MMEYREITNAKHGTTYEPDDVFIGKEHYPRCCFFDLFPMSADPYEKYYGVMFCHMDLTEQSAKVCKGDYCKCPLAGNVVQKESE